MKLHKVLHLSSATEVGGNEIHIITLLKYLPKDRYDVTVAVPQGGKFEVLLWQSGYKVLLLPYQVRANIATLLHLWRLLRANRFHILHTHNRREDFIGALAARLAGTPAVVSTVHNKINVNQDGVRITGFKAWVYSTNLSRLFDMIITVSEATRQDLLDQLAIEPDRIVHVVNGTDLDRLRIKVDPVARRRGLGFAEESPLIGLVARVRGRWGSIKGLPYLLRAAPRVLREVPDAAFLIIGNDAEAEKYYAEIASELGVGGHVFFLGYRSDVLEIVSALDVAVLPSLFEGFGRALAEAMGLGIAVVGTAVDGIRELIVHGESGLLVEPRDPQGLAKAIVQILKNEELKQKLGEAGRKRVETHFDARIMGEETAKIYDNILSSKKMVD